MKNIVISLLVFSLIFSLCIQTSEAKTNQDWEGTISISGAWALYPLAVKWAEEFQKVYPKIKLDISAGGAGKGMADCLSGIVDIGMISRDIKPEEVRKGAWWVSVTKDAVIPTINAKNPFVKEILSKGIKKETFINIWVTGQIKKWSELTDIESSEQINVYTRCDACGAAETWANYLNAKQPDLNGVGVYGDPGLAEAVKNDIFGIGYNNVNFAYDPETELPVSGIKIIPIDINENGKIDDDENFYDNRQKIVKAIVEDKYPSPPARNLHFACLGRPTKRIVVEFIKWALTEGQKFVSESGYVNLTEEKLNQELNKLSSE